VVSGTPGHPGCGPLSLRHRSDVNAGRAGDVVTRAPPFSSSTRMRSAAANEPRHLHPVVAEGFGELIGDVAAHHDAVLGEFIRSRIAAARPSTESCRCRGHPGLPGRGSGLGRPPVASSKRSYGNVLHLPPWQCALGVQRGDERIDSSLYPSFCCSGVRRKTFSRWPRRAETAVGRRGCREGTAR